MATDSGRTLTHSPTWSQPCITFPRTTTTRTLSGPGCIAQLSPHLVRVVFEGVVFSAPYAGVRHRTGNPRSGADDRGADSGRLDPIAGGGEGDGASDSVAAQLRDRRPHLLRLPGRRRRGHQGARATAWGSRQPDLCRASAHRPAEIRLSVTAVRLPGRGDGSIG